MKNIFSLLTVLLTAGFTQAAFAQVPPAPLVSKEVKLKDIKLRDVCVLPDKQKGIYYMVGPGRNASVVIYTSKDLVNWVGPKEIFRTPQNLCPILLLKGYGHPKCTLIKANITCSLPLVPIS